MLIRWFGIIVFFATFFCCALSIVYYDGTSNSLTLIFRYIALPVGALLLVIIFIKDKSFTDNFYQNLININKRFALLYIIFAYFVIIFSLKALKYYSLNFEHFDAGLYTNKLYRISVLGIYDGLRIALFEGHFQPVMMFFAWSYSILQSVLVPFALETIFLSSGAIPVYLLAKRLWQREAHALMVALIYLLNPMVQFNDILGFHPDHLVLPFILWAFYLAESGRYKLSILAACFIACCGEPWIPLVAMFGIFLVIHHRQYISGGLCFVVMSILFYSIFFLILPKFNSWGIELISPGSSYHALISLDFNEIINLEKNYKKIFFIIFIFSPFVFSPFFSISFFLTIVPELMKTLLSTEMLHYSVDGHYTLGIVAVCFVSYIYFVRNIAEKHSISLYDRLPLLTLVLSLALSISNSPLPTSLNFYSYWSGGNFRYSNYTITDRTKSLQKVENIIGDNQYLKLEVTNGIFSPKLTMRRERLDFFPSSTWRNSDFIVVDKVKSLSTGSQSHKAAYIDRFNTAHKELSKVGFKLVFSDDFVEVWEKSSRWITE